MYTVLAAIDQAVVVQVGPFWPTAHHAAAYALCTLPMAEFGPGGKPWGVFLVDGTGVERGTGRFDHLN